MDVVLGLKGCMKKYKGCFFIYKVKRLYWELKYAWQRVWNGYDDREIFNLDASIRNKLIVLLSEYKKNNNCLWRCPDGYKLGEYNYSTDMYFLTKDQMDTIIDMIIWHLRMTDENYCEKWLYGSCIYGCRNIDECKHISNIILQNYNAAMDLIKIFGREMWY